VDKVEGYDGGAAEGLVIPYNVGSLVLGLTRLGARRAGISDAAREEVPRVGGFVRLCVAVRGLTGVAGSLRSCWPSNDQGISGGCSSKSMVESDCWSRTR
jgi:hypothetical protein